MLRHERAVGDTLKKLAVTIQDDGTPRDLTGKSVIFVMKTLSGENVVSAGSVTITDGTNGECEYDFQAADVDTAGVFKAWFVIQGSGPEYDTYPNNEDGIQVTIFDETASTVEPDPSIDLIAMANAPARTRTVEGTVEERSMNELIKADQYTQSKDAANAVPWGIRISRTRPGGMTT